MKSIRITLSLALALAVSALLFDATAVQAMTCDSVCSQIRRACRSQAMGNLKVDYADCDQDRDDCRVACDLNAEQCPLDCEAAFEACGGASVPGCADALALCMDACDNCKRICNSDRVQCRIDAKVARDGANLICDGMRESCDGLCMEPINQDCVRECKSGRRGCDGGVKRAEKLCRAECPKGTGQRACVRSCRRQKNLDLADCALTEVGCFGICASLPQ